MYYVNGIQVPKKIAVQMFEENKCLIHEVWQGQRPARALLGVHRIVKI